MGNKQKEEISKFPLVFNLTYKYEIDDEEKQLFLFISEFENAIQVAVYDNQPKLGSISLAYQINQIVENYPVFTGNNNEYANALAMIIAKRRGKMVYASVNIDRSNPVNLDMLKQLITKYFDQINN